MLKLMFSGILCLAFVCPTVLSAQDCDCCDAASVCQKTRKKIALVDVTREVKRLKRVCETDECGCSKSRLALVSECVTRKRLALVDVPVDPCKPNVLQRMTDRVKSLSFRRHACDEGCGCETCDSGCGCDSMTDSAYPAIGYPTDAAPMEMSYPSNAVAPMEMSYPAPSGAPTEIAPRHSGDAIN